MKKNLFVIAFIIFNLNLAYPQADTSTFQNDSLFFRESDLKRVSMNYFNLSRPNKFNFEVIVIGGVKNSGIYLIPEGTSLVEVVALTGGATDESIFENFKLIRTKEKNPELRKDTVFTFDYIDFFKKEQINTMQKANPILKPGDIIAFSIKPEKEFWDIAQRIAGVIIVPLLTLGTLIVTIMNYNLNK